MLSTPQARLVAEAAISDTPAAEPALLDAAGAMGTVDWMPAVAASMFYPVAVGLFVDGYHAARAAAGASVALWSLGALVMLAVAIAAPALALQGLYRIRQNTSSKALAVRRLLHLAVTVPPLYLVWIRVAGLGSLRGSTGALLGWWACWLVLAVLVWSAGRGRAAGSVSGVVDSRAVDSNANEPPSLLALVTGRARKVHRMAVVAVLVTFLVLHLASHLFALWSVPAQQTVMNALRTWYRAIWMEPVILALFVVAALAGLLRLTRLTRSPADGFRVLQTASGGYLAVFLVSHIWATLGARYHGIDTNWAFASGGKAGMLGSGVGAQVLLYYVFALLAVSVHAGLGLRMVYLSRRVRAVAANRAARVTFVFGSAVSVLIVAALLGVRLAGIG